MFSNCFSLLSNSLARSFSAILRERSTTVFFNSFIAADFSFSIAVFADSISLFAFSVASFSASEIILDFNSLAQGFTVDLIQNPGPKCEFYCFIWDPNGSGGGSASFVGSITGPTSPEKFASAYTFDEESKVVCKAGQYLFAVQRVPNGAKQLVHLTAYIRYDS